MASTTDNPRRRGQGLIEYMLILVLVSIIVIGALQSIGAKSETPYQDMAVQMP